MVRFALVLLVASTTAVSAPPNLEETLATQQELVASQPYEAAGHNDLGNLLVLGGRHEAAQDSYRRAIELEPANTLPRFNLGVLLQQIGLSREAMVEYRSLLEIDERHARAHYQLGMLYESRGRRKAALEHYAQAFAFDPDLTFPRNNPHLIDNRLATEAILMSGQFSDAPSSGMPRLYGEPERIAELMLRDHQSLPEPESETAEPRTEPLSTDSPSQALQREIEADPDPEDEEEANREDEEDEEEDSDEEDSDEEAEGRRTLTREDLAVGSSVGQVRQSGGSAHSPTRQPASRAGAAPPKAQSGRDLSTGRTPRPTTGRPPAANEPRYRPASRFSTGRLELELLPAETPDQRAETS